MITWRISKFIGDLLNSEIAPITWIKTALEKIFKGKKKLDPKKIMVGLPFYGYFFFPNGHKAVSKKEYL